MATNNEIDANARTSTATTRTIVAYQGVTYLPKRKYYLTPTGRPGSTPVPRRPLLPGQKPSCNKLPRTLGMRRLPGVSFCDNALIP
jgi:hypothetical protein